VTTSHIFGLAPIVNIRTCFYWEQRCESSLALLDVFILAFWSPIQFMDLPHSYHSKAMIAYPVSICQS